MVKIRTADSAVKKKLLLITIFNQTFSKCETEKNWWEGLQANCKYKLQANSLQIHFIGLQASSCVLCWLDSFCIFLKLFMRGKLVYLLNCIDKLLISWWQNIFYIPLTCLIDIIINPRIEIWRVIPHLAIRHFARGSFISSRP